MSEIRTRDGNITIVAKPPRPASGEGEVIVDFRGRDITLVWSGGNIIGLKASLDEHSGEGSVEIEDMTTRSTQGVVTCYKCAKDSVTGERVCWDVPC